MVYFIFKRILIIIPLLFGILTLTFILLHIAPGDPLSNYFSQGVSNEVRERLYEQFGYNEPILTQYFKWLKNFISFDFGYSYDSFRPVKDILKETIPNTLILTIPALIIEYIIGITFGIVMALHRRKIVDNILTFFNMVIYSLPGFWFALMFIIIFSLKLGWFPPSGMYSAGIEYQGLNEQFFDLLRHMALPVIILGIGSASSTARYMRGSMIQVLHQPYILLARAKGLSEKRVIFVHAFRNAMIPIVTLSFLSLPDLIGGAIVLEWIFAWPGMGRLTVDAIFARDFPVIMAATFIVSILVLMSNLAADVIYKFVDPRIRLSQERS